LHTGVMQSEERSAIQPEKTKQYVQKTSFSPNFELLDLATYWLFESSV